jgi:hypothetical protein
MESLLLSRATSSSAGTGTSQATVKNTLALTLMPGLTNAPFVATKDTICLPSPAIRKPDPQPIPTPLLEATSSFDFLTTMHICQTPVPCLLAHKDIFSLVTTPYNTLAFTSLLEKHDLTAQYPFLVHNLCNSFPMGKFPNHPSAISHKSAICAYLKDEVALKQMSGPFVHEEMMDIMTGSFQSLPLIVDVQTQPGHEPVMSSRNSTGVFL